MSLSIKLLGEFSLYREGKKISLPKSKRTRALLAYLILLNKPHRRDRLCDVFWSIPDDPRGALRWSLSKLRLLVDDSNEKRIQADRESIFLSIEDISIDVCDLSEKIKNENLTVTELTNIFKLLDEPFLSGIDLPNQELFQHWLVSERNEINKMQCHVLSILSGHSELPIFEQVVWSKIWLERAPYDIRAANLILSQLDFLERSTEKENLLRTLTLRFKKAGIQWSPVKNITFDFLETTTTNKEDIRNIHERQKTKFCITEDDVSLAYASIGEGYPIVKTANWLSHLEYDWDAPIWSPLFRHLALEHLFLRYDERGNGLSDWDVEDISFDAFVKDLETVVAATNLDKFALLGISQGASVAIEYAVRHPEKVSHLILFGGYAAGWRIGASQREIEEREAVMTLTKNGWGQNNPAYRQIFSSTFLPSANKEEFDWFNEYQRLTTSPENAVRFLSVFSQIDVRHQLAKIKVPTLVIHSLGDQRIPIETGKQMASMIPNAEFIGLESDGHLLLGREPSSKIFVDAIKDFINRV